MATAREWIDNIVKKEIGEANAQLHARNARFEIKRDCPSALGFIFEIEYIANGNNSTYRFTTFNDTFSFSCIRRLDRSGKDAMSDIREYKERKIGADDKLVSNIIESIIQEND